MSCFIEKRREAKFGRCVLVIKDDTMLAQLDNTLLNMIGCSKEEWEHEFQNAPLNAVFGKDAGKVYNALKDGLDTSGEFRLIKKSGGCIWVRSYRFSQSCLEEGIRSEYMIVDASQEVADRRELESLNCELKNVNDAIPGGVIQIVLSNPVRLVYANDSFYQLAGYTRAEYLELTQDEPLKLVHPDDLQKMLALASQKSGEKEWSEIFEYRIRKKDGTWTWRLNYGKIVGCEPDGSTYMQCVVLDCNEKKNLELKLEMEKERYRVVAQLADGVLWEYNCKTDEMLVPYHHKSVLVNKEVTAHFSRNPFTLVSVHPEDMGAFEQFCTEIQEGKEHIVFEFRGLKKNGSYCWYLSEGTTIYDKSGKPQRVVGLTTNIDSKKKESLNLKRAAECDPLTGLFLVVQEKIDHYLKNRTNNSVGGLLLLNVDDFKEINTKLGHLFGDALLINVAQALKEQMNPDDLLGRVGGDEFILFFKNCSKEEGLKRADEICHAVRGIYSGELEDTKLSISIGIAGYPRCGSTYAELFNCADKALRYAKNQGKNRYVLYDQQMPYVVHEAGQRLLTFNELEQTGLVHNNKLEEIVDIFPRILGTTKDLNSAIYLLLDKIGRYCGVSYAGIMECSIDNTRLQATFLWCSGGGRMATERESSFLIGEWPKYLECYDENGMFAVSDLQLEQLPQSFKDYVQCKSLLQCGIYDSNFFRGCVFVADAKGSRDWGENETRVVSEFASAVTPYLLRRQISADAQYRLDMAINFDELTSLHSMTSFKSNMQKLLVKEQEAKFAIVYLDIVDFKFINDIYGFAGGDQLLRDFAEMLTSLGSELSCRLGNDSFISLMRYETLEELREYIMTYNKEFHQQQKEKLPHSNVLIAAGICPLSETGNDIVAAIDNANIARKSVKAFRRGACAIFDKGMKHRHSVEMEMSSRMEYSLSHGEFVVYLQPKVALPSGNLIGAEALVRWKTPDGLIPPDDFIPFFEKNGFVTRLDLYVLGQVLEHMAQWMEAGFQVVPISVNLSRLHVENPDETEQIMNLIQQYNMEPEKIEFELTETAFFQDAERLRHFMQSLMMLGFGVSIDDFGSGYSSLNILPTMPANILKLDKEFLRNHGDSGRSKVLVKHMVAMARELDFSVICEGVETEEDVEFLRSVGCNAAQGYYFARPMPIIEFEMEWLK